MLGENNLTGKNTLCISHMKRHLYMASLNIPTPVGVWYPATCGTTTCGTLFVDLSAVIGRHPSPLSVMVGAIRQLHVKS